MHDGTDAEVVQFLSDNKWDCGIKVAGANLCYECPEADCIELRFPDLPGRAAYFSSKAPKSQGCSGPSGNGKVAGAGFLAQDYAAGALIMRTRDGRTWFSVNGRSGTAFKDNEGFYEFDLDVK